MLNVRHNNYLFEHLIFKDRQGVFKAETRIQYDCRDHCGLPHVVQ